MADAKSAQAAVASGPTVVFKKRGTKGAANFRKRPATPPPAEDDDSFSDFSSSEDEAGQRVKRRKKNNGAVTASSKDDSRASKEDITATVFAADRNVDLKRFNDATKQSNWHDEGSTDKKSSKKPPDKPEELEMPDGTYKGLANQTNFIKKNPNARPSMVGPMKAPPTNVRTITVTDFAPDVCKSYKLYGYCGFGDNCKYLHAREAYKAGWELDREWDIATKGKKNIGGTVVASADRKKTEGGDEEDEDETMLENIPWVCIICKEPYKSPIITRCGHYFCEPCALKRYRKDPTCAACGTGTNGVFNGAKRLQKLLDRKKERAARRRQEAIDAGEDVEDEDEEE